MFKLDSCQIVRSYHVMSRGKQRLTLMPYSNASGTHKLKLLVVGKSVKPHAFKNTNIALSVIYKVQKRAWASHEVFLEWYKRDFVPSVKTFLTKYHLPLKAVLLLDNAPSHSGEDELRIKTRDGYIEVML